MFYWKKAILASFAATMSVFSASCGTDYGAEDVNKEDTCASYASMVDTCCADADATNADCDDFRALECACPGNTQSEN